MQTMLTVNVIFCICVCSCSKLTRNLKVESLKEGIESNKLRIINGVPAKVGEFPYQAGLQIPYTSGYIKVCGGSLITNLTIMTAAHCLATIMPQNATSIKVTLNSLDFYGRSSGAIVVRVSSIFVHPKFATNPENDIALVYLTKPVKTVKPVLLPCATSAFTGITGTVAGWGLTNGSDLNSSSTTKLMTTKMTVLNSTACALIQSSMNGLQICAIAKGTNTCHGDSGGALTINGVAVGIVSYGNNNCKSSQQYATVFTKVSAFLIWIKTNQK